MRWPWSIALRVALESLREEYGTTAKSLRVLKNTPARQVFQLREGRRSLVAVVTRPYWLSFFARSRRW
jgi:hypothetical protein